MHDPYCPAGPPKRGQKFNQKAERLRKGMDTDGVRWNANEDDMERTIGLRGFNHSRACT